MRKVLLILLLVVCFAGIAPAQESKTVINDQTAKTKLLGKHLFSLQWISWDDFGAATVTENKGILRIKGTQKSRKGGDYVTIDGVISKINAKDFTFNGKIVTQISYINDGKPCVREGEMIFKITGNRKYWRLQQMLNPCTNIETDYVDIYFRK